MLSQRWKPYRICSASNEIRSAYAQCVMKFVPRMIGIFWMRFLKWVVISPPYAEHAQKLVTHWLGMRGNWLLVGWACAQIGYSLAEHTQKSFWRTLSQYMSFWVSICIVPCFSNFTRSSVTFSRSLTNVLCPRSHVSVPCLPSSGPCLLSSVPCLTSLFLISPPLFPVSLLCSLSPILCFLSHVSVPCLPSSVHNLTSLFLVSRPLSPILSLCSLFHIHLSLSPNPVNCPVVP